MKKLLIMLVILGFTTMAFAALKVEEESYVKYTLELEKLRAERNNLIITRDAELVVEQNKYNDAQQVIIDAYETQIVSKEAEIATKEADLNNIIVTP